MAKITMQTQEQPQPLPVLYSLRNCPYAMRARIAIFKAEITIELRDIVLKNKPAEMLLSSPKGTVPTLIIQEKTTGSSKVIDESLEVMLWALTTSDPCHMLQGNKPETLAQMLVIIHQFDEEFKTALEAYKCAKRYHEVNIEECRIACEQYIMTLEERLNQHPFLMGEKESLLDIALLPFIRQFSKIERQWYLQAPYPKLRQWLNNYLQSPMFTKVMAKYPLWQDDAEMTLFGKV